MKNGEHREPGSLMRREAADAIDVFVSAATADHREAVRHANLDSRRAFYTVARGSSDAAANVISYELMREVAIATTSMPPSVFSLGAGVKVEGLGVLVVSQSGASDDLVLSARGARAGGATVIGITNRPNSDVSAESDITLPIGAGPELAVPATKSVIGAIATGIALIAAIKPEYGDRSRVSAMQVASFQGVEHPKLAELSLALQTAQHVYVIGRDTGLGAALEVALKLKECCALHAEAHSSSEVLHGPLQLVTRPLLILMLDTEHSLFQQSLDNAQVRFREAGCEVWRIRPSDIGAEGLTPAAAAALLLNLMYPVILSAALALGLDPDRPNTLAKETMTI